LSLPYLYFRARNREYMAPIREEDNREVTLALLGTGIEHLTELVERHHNEDCAWREKTENRISKLELWQAAREEWVGNHSMAHKLIYTVMAASLSAEIILAVYLSAHLGVPIILK
jgi:hypothetical protein